MLGIVAVDGGGGGDGVDGANVAAVVAADGRWPLLEFRRNSPPEEAKLGMPEPRKPSVSVSVARTPGLAFCRWLGVVFPDSWWTGFRPLNADSTGESQ